MNKLKRLRCGAGVAALVCLAVVAAADDVRSSQSVDIAGGSLVVIRRDGVASRELVIHFHGAAGTIQAAYERSRSHAVVAIVNFRGLSSAYARPFSSDADLFSEIQRLAWMESRDVDEQHTPPAWERVTLSSFSAGYGAIREILKTPADFDRVDAIVAADSIYAGLLPDRAMRQVDPDNMSGFLRFADHACGGRKTFVISHSSQTTEYASTTETVDYLLQQLQLERRPDAALSSDGWMQTTRAERGKLIVLGFAGATGEDHMQHLRRIDILWQIAPLPKE